MLTPNEHFGFEPGTSRRLITWAAAVEYYQAIAARSDRVRCDVRGKSTLGAPFLALTISSPANLARYDHLKSIQQRLADPRNLANDQAEALIDEGRAIVTIGCSIHPAEVGAAQMAPLLVHELASRDDPETRAILDEVILILLPSVNPDGMKLVTDWYERTKGTLAEGTWPPEISHKYVGGENNRDWVMHTQVENRLVVDHVFNAWLPHLELDMHQQEPDGPRLVVPPYIDPVDPDVDPSLTALANQVGATIAADLTASDLRGVASRTLYQLYSPHTNYAQHHGGVRILTEAASCELASPVTIVPSAFRIMGGVDPAVPGVDNPAPWPGGAWRLEDVVAYDKAAAYAVLRFAAGRRRALVANFARIFRDALRRERPYAFVIPGDQSDQARVAELIEVLLRGKVVVERSRAAIEANRTRYPAGTFVVRLKQPFGGYAKTLLEKREYPAPSQYPGGPVRPPYDIATHCLPLYFGLRVDQVNEPFDAELEPLDAPPRSVGRVAGGGRVFLLSATGNQSTAAAAELLRNGARATRVVTRVEAADRQWPAGAYVFRDCDTGLIREIAHEFQVDITAVQSLECEERRQRLPRLALYKPSMTGFAVCDEGWARFVLERHGLTPMSLSNVDVRTGDLAARFDVIIVASMLAKDLLTGQDPREFPGVPPSNRDLPPVEEDTSTLRLSLPAPYAGGLGELGMRQLRAFVEAGGTLIALDSSCDAVIDHLGVPVENALRGLSRDAFSCPGSLLRLIVDAEHPIGWGVEREVAALCLHSPAFAVGDEARAVARHVSSGHLVSGWLRGGERLSGRAALVEASLGRGRVILFGFRPHFRAQARGTYRLLFNAILSAGLE